MSKGNGQLIRPMSYHEASFPVYAELAPGAGNIVAVVTINAEISCELLEQCVAFLASKYEILNCGFFDKADSGKVPDFHLVKTEGVAPQVHYIESEEETLQAEMDRLRYKLLHHHFLPEEPLTQFGAICTADLGQTSFFVCLNHGIGDGQSVVNIFKSALSYFDIVIGTDNRPKVAQEAIQKVPEPLWIHMPKKLSNAFGGGRSLLSLPKLIGYQKQADRGFGFPIEVYAPCEEHRCKAIYFGLEEAVSKKVFSWIKSQKASAHGVLSAALFFAWMDELKGEGGRFTDTDSGKVKSFPVITSVNVRGKLDTPVSDELVGCYSSGVSSDIGFQSKYLDAATSVGPEDYLNVAKDVIAGVESGLEEGQHWKILRLYQLLGMKGLKKMLLDSSEKSMSFPLSVANIGNVNFGQFSAISVLDFDIQPAFHAMGPGVNAVVYSINGQIKLCLNAAYPVTQEATLRRFGQRALAHFESIASFA